MVPDYGEGILGFYPLVLGTLAAFPAAAIVGVVAGRFARASAVQWFGIGFLSGLLGTGFNAAMVGAITVTEPSCPSATRCSWPCCSAQARWQQQGRLRCYGFSGGERGSDD